MMSLLNNDMKRKIKKAARIARIKPFYQEQRSSAFADRWAIIEPELSADDRSVLDIGCNIGQFTAKCADRGMFAIGIDAFEEVVARAVKVNRGSSRRVCRAISIGCIVFIAFQAVGNPFVVTEKRYGVGRG